MQKKIAVCGANYIWNKRLMERIAHLNQADPPIKKSFQPMVLFMPHSTWKTYRYR